jgi:hypothetical protein
MERWVADGIPRLGEPDAVAHGIVMDSLECMGALPYHAGYVCER